MTDNASHLKPGLMPKVISVARCELRVSDETWAYADVHGAAIERYWQDQIRRNPNYFNGPIFLLASWTLYTGEAFHAKFLRTDFRSYLYWRGQSFEPAGVFDAFGSGLVRSADGALMLGEQTAGNVNSGLSYPPSGFIDDQDVGGGMIDIDAAISRELREETGLSVQHLCRQPGYLITMCGAQISIAAIFQSDETAANLTAEIEDWLTTQDDRELARVHFAGSLSDMVGLTVPDYAKVLFSYVARTGSETGPTK